MKSNLILATIIALTLASCGIFNQKDNNAVNALIYSKWKVKEIDGKVIPPKINNVDHYLIFNSADKVYSATTGCNTLNGSVEIGSNSIVFKNGISTMMACTDMSFESSLKSKFSAIKKYNIKDHTLYLYDDKGKETMKLELISQSTSKALNGNWELDYMANTNESIRTSLQQQKIALTFNSSDNTLSGKGACNKYSSTYTSQGKSLHIGNIASTRMACPNLETESIYFKNLEKVTSYSIHEQTLTLIAGDIAIMRFKKK